MRTEEQFWAKVDKSGECWLWTGALRGGYGAFCWSGRKRHHAHRMAWLLLNGPIADGLHVCHNCPGGDNPRCVNPAHMFLGTASDNLRDAYKKGRRVPHNAARSHCIHGHPFSGDNLRINSDGERACRECDRLRDQRRRAAKLTPPEDTTPRE